MSQGGPKGAAPFNPLLNVEEMARHGMAYDFSEGRPRSPNGQKRGGKWNKNNRKDRNSRSKEVSMSAQAERRNAERESSHRLPPHDDSPIVELSRTLERGLLPLTRLDETLKAINESNVSMTAAAKALDGTMTDFKATMIPKLEAATTAALDAKAAIVEVPVKTVQEKNKFLSIDNVKGDVRTGLVLGGMSGLAALAVWAFTAIFMGGNGAGAAQPPRRPA